jgi:thioredoxin 1
MIRRVVMGAGTLTITEENFENEVLKSESPVLVDFWAEWCAPCIALGPVIEELASDYEGKVKVGKLNIDEAQDISVKYGIRSIPTVAIFKGGEIVDMRVGLASKDDLAGRLDEALG